MSTRGWGLMVFDTQLGSALLQDVSGWNAVGVQRSLGVVRSFTAGAALVAGPDGRPIPRPALAVVTADELVLLDADPVVSPDGVIDRLPLGHVVGGGSSRSSAIPLRRSTSIR